MGEQKYRVVLTGKLVPGFKHEDIMAGVSKELQTSAVKIRPIFEGKELPVLDLLSAHDAAVLQRRLEHLGALVRVDRITDPEAALQAADGLRLPERTDPVEAGMMHCPACGHAQLVARSCDECGVVFAEYNREHKRGVVPTPVSAPAPARRPQRPRQRPPKRRPDVYEDDGWRNEWVDEADEPATEEYHLRLFMGVGSGHLAEGCIRMTLGRRIRFRPTWVGSAVISPFLWAMNRKMWAWSTLIFVLEILIPVVLITLGTKDNVSDKLSALAAVLIIGNRIFWPAILKMLYCRHARQTIAQMHRMAPTYAADIDIATRGGTSKTSVVVGIVLIIVLSLLTWSLADALHASISAARADRDVPIELSAIQRPPTAAPPTATRDAALANENRWVSTRSRLRQLGQRVNAWIADRGDTLDPLALDIEQISSGLLLGPGETVDGWGNEIRYDSDGKGYRLVSAGPDGEFGNSDDVEYRRMLER